MSWQLSFQARPNERVHRYFWSATIWDDIEPIKWWSDKANAFIDREHPLYEVSWTGTHSKPIRTLKAFKRFLRKHSELETEGRTVRLVNRYVGLDIEAVWMP